MTGDLDPHRRYAVHTRAIKIIDQLELGNVTAAAVAFQTDDDQVLLAAAIGAHIYIDGPHDAMRIVHGLASHPGGPTN